MLFGQARELATKVKTLKKAGEKRPFVSVELRKLARCTQVVCAGVRALVRVF